VPGEVAIEVEVIGAGGSDAEPFCSVEMTGRVVMRCCTWQVPGYQV